MASTVLNAAVKVGLLPRVQTLVCVDCGRQAQGYDHRDYSKPLEVDPVCMKCNKLRGPAVGARPPFKPVDLPL